MNQALSDFYLAVGFQPYDWFGLFCLFTVLDGALTAYGLKQGAMESNRAMKWIMSKLGVIPTLALFKLLGISAVYSGLQGIILYIPLLVLFYVGVCGWNVWVIKRRLK